MPQPRLLQVCNVGQICGGTAACAWTVTRSLPAWEHHVAFAGTATAETREVFGHACVWDNQPIDRRFIEELRPDILLLHNQSADRVHQPLPAPTLQYLHSAIRPAQASLTLCCSHWLAQRMRLPAESVLWQAVPRPAINHNPPARGQPGTLIVGRLCTPVPAKWPAELIPWYADLAESCPQVRWEFVGCPDQFQAALTAACQGRATFHPAGWLARSHLHRWDVLLYHHPRIEESFGRTVAEAMRAGCIPVIDHSGGFIEQVAEGCGMLCTSRTEFIAALQRLGDRAVRGRMARLTRERGDREFSLERFARNLLTRFDQAAVRFRSGAAATAASASSSTVSPRARRSA